MSGKLAIQRGSGWISSAIHRCGGGRVLAAGSVWLAFLEGQGAGAGWDLENEIRTAAGFVRGESPVILDIGANRGVWSAGLARKLANPRARFFLFEVAPYCFDEIALRQTAIPNFTLVARAVSDRQERLDFHLPTSFSGLASLHRRQDVGVRQRQYQVIQVDTIRLDDFARDAGLDRIALAKMDIEGHELFALKGAGALLSERRIDCLTFEFGSANVNSRTFFKDFWDYLTGFGYSIHRMLPGGGTVAVTRYSERLEYFRGATNYIATAGGRS